MVDIVVRRVVGDIDMEAAKSIRMEVFVQEQHVPEEEEMDEYDDTAIHAIAISRGIVIGTGRLILGGLEAKIGRMAVLQPERRSGVGSLLIEWLENEAIKNGAVVIALHAQTYVSDFYEKHGYTREGHVFFEAGIEHLLMRKKLSSDTSSQDVLR